MNILHICVGGPYTDGWNYQENMLTKYQARMGHEVSLLGSQYRWGKNGKTEFDDSKPYINEDKVNVYRLPIKGEKDVFYRYKRFIGFFETIEQIKPDIIFVHNLQFMDIDQIVKYAKRNAVVIYADNHADYSNSARSLPAKLFYKIVWRHYAKMIEPYVKKFYGVLPSRVEFLKKIYALPPEKCELLVMGGDDELIEKAEAENSGQKIRDKYGIAIDDFLIVTGGKIDEYKTQTLLLMEAVKRIENPKVRLIVFGSIADSLKEKVNSLVDGIRIQNVGWIDSAGSYDYFAAADLVVFPGRHSVFWEQVVAQGKPMVCKYWDGTTHVDVGGNVKFLESDSEEKIVEVINQIIEGDYSKMLSVAQEEGRRQFSYRKIAQRAIGE